MTDERDDSPRTSLARRAESKPIFQQRGYSLCFLRMPTFTLAVQREILDDATRFVRSSSPSPGSGQPNTRTYRRTSSANSSRNA